MIGGLAFLSLQLIAVNAQAANIPIDPGPRAVELRQQAGDEELLLFAVELDSGTLTESLSAYGDLDDPLLPVGELSRLLDLNIAVDPAHGRITGTLGEAERALTVDLGQSLARSGGDHFVLRPGDASVSPADIFIRASLLQSLLPLKIAIDAEALLITLTATEKLPVQARMDRQERMLGLDAGAGETEAALAIKSPYLLVSAPAFDVALETGRDTRGGGLRRRYDVRMAGDLLHWGYQGYLGSDETGHAVASRLLVERKSREGGLLGPLDATYASAGDVYTPPLAIGPRSVGGRGFTFSTAPLGEASVFQRITLRGELPIGYDVELYINDILRSGQRTAVEGRYEFVDVPLVRGLNVVRLVLYGPRGERSEQTRVVNVGGGQLATGEMSFDFGIVEQEKPLIDLRSREERAIATPGAGKLRATANLAYGLSEAVTIVGAAAVYPGRSGERRQLVSAGVRGSLFGLAAQADAAFDHKGGTGFLIGLAGQPFGVSTLARHAEYSGGFQDETLSIASGLRPLRRHSEVTADLSLPPIGGKIIPISFRLERDVFRDGGVTYLALGRASGSVANVLVSAGMDYLRESVPGSPSRKRLAGNLAMSKFIDYKWQVRGVVDYELVPETTVRALSITAARDISERASLRFGLGRTFGQEKDLNLQAGAFFRLPFADLAVTGDYATAQRDWRIGLRLAFGLAFDPSASRYRMTRPGPAAGASALLHAFVDSNGNGRFDRGEEPVRNVSVDGGERRMVTDQSGRAFVTGLGNSTTGRLRVGVENIDGFYMTAPPSNVEIEPRPGRVIEIPYPLSPVGDALVRVVFRQKGGQITPLSAVRVRLVREGKAAAIGTTEFDGSVIFGELRPGLYMLELDPEQSGRLGMTLSGPVPVKVSAEGATNIEAEVLFEET